MPRKARIDAPGALRHIIIRGIERKKIFRSESDRKDFLGRLGDLVAQTQTDCFAWALIDNHAHLLFRTGLTPEEFFKNPRHDRTKLFLSQDWGRTKLSY